MNMKQTSFFQHSISIHSVPCRVRLDSEAINKVFHWSKISEVSASAIKIYVRRERGSGEKQKSRILASWLSMINKNMKDECAVGRGRKEVIMWQKSYSSPSEWFCEGGSKKVKNPTSTHNDSSQNHGESTDEELPSNVSWYYDICQIPFALTVAWPEPASSFFGTKLELHCKNWCRVGSVLCTLWSKEKWKCWSDLIAGCISSGEAAA